MLVYILRFSLPGGYYCWSAQLSALSSQLELQIIPIEQNILCSLFSFALSVVGTLGKMSTQILVVRCLVISLKSQIQILNPRVGLNLVIILHCLGVNIYTFQLQLMLDILSHFKRTLNVFDVLILVCCNIINQVKLLVMPCISCVVWNKLRQ